MHGVAISAFSLPTFLRPYIRYFGVPGSQEWNGACGEGPSLISAYASRPQLASLGSCSLPGDVCLVRTRSGSGRESVIWNNLSQHSSDLVKESLMLQKYRCKNVGESVNREVLRKMETDPAGSDMTKDKVRDMWNDGVVFF